MNYPYQYYPPYPYTQQPYQNNLYPKQQINYEIEKRLRQEIRYDLMAEYDEIISLARVLLEKIIINPNNSLKKDSKYIYLVYNNKVLTNPLENIDEIEKELSTVLSEDIKIVKDTKDIVEEKRLNPHIVYLPMFLIPNKIEPTIIFDIYDNVKDGYYYFNLFRYTSYLTKRFEEIPNDRKIKTNQWCQFTFKSVSLNPNVKCNHEELLKTYFIKHFLFTFTKNTNSEYIEEWLTYFFKTLRRRREALVLIGNRDVSEEMFYNAIIKQIFGFDYCSTIDDWMLENLTVAQIIENKLFIHINYIPEDKNLQKKLKDVIEAVIVYNYDKEYSKDTRYVQTIPFLCQIIFTLDSPEPFLSDFLSSSKAFFIDSIENVNKKLNQPDRVSLLNNITKNLDEFSKQLAALDLSQVKRYGDDIIIDINSQKVMNERITNFSNKIVPNDTVNFKEKDYKNDNELYKDWIKNPELMEFALSNNKDKPILDPFHESFETILPKEYRYKHTYITGKTGSGKSELLKTLIYRDILRNDCSVILLDIHGDLAKDVTRLVKDKERVVLIDPILEKDFTPTINLFDTKDKSEENIEQVSQMISSVINSINVGDTLSGTMIDVLENCIPVLIRDNNKDFYELKSFMKTINKEKVNTKITIEDHLKSDDEKYNKLIKLALNSKNEFEKDYFKNEFINASAATKNAVKRRLNKMLKNTLFSNLTNGKSTIDLEKEMNTKGKVIIFNIPKSKMLNTYSHYIKFIIGLIQIIALKRADLPENKRIHTHLYIDEFHNFITPTIEEILAESRKYKLFLTLAHQSISQIKDANLRDIILDNTNVKIIGKNSNKTLDSMNKTLNVKLEDVEKLKAGEFNLQSGTNDVIKIYNSDKLLNKQEQISDEEWIESKQYQLDKYYRTTIKEEIEEIEKDNQSNEDEDLDKMIDEFIQAIKEKDLSETSCLKRIEEIEPKRFEEIEEDLKKNRIRQQEINIVFKLAFKYDKPLTDEITNVLNNKFGKAQMMSQNKKYRDKSQEKYYSMLSED